LTWCGVATLSFREKELHLESRCPFPDAVGSDDVVINLRLSVHREFANAEDLADAAADWLW